MVLRAFLRFMGNEQPTQSTHELSPSKDCVLEDDDFVMVGVSQEDVKRFEVTTTSGHSISSLEPSTSSKKNKKNKKKKLNKNEEIIETYENQLATTNNVTSISIFAAPSPVELAKLVNRPVSAPEPISRGSLFGSKSLTNEPVLPSMCHSKHQRRTHFPKNCRRKI
eukprot:GILI01001235.1.p1 GENE.GILI01001235.1~~GILI01001235.1.p1  ORF type:complete len:166 (+),score=51.94 GILI01001235.1:165-662(+)